MAETFTELLALHDTLAKRKAASGCIPHRRILKWVTRRGVWVFEKATLRGGSLTLSFRRGVSRFTVKNSDTIAGRVSIALQNKTQDQRMTFKTAAHERACVELKQWRDISTHVLSEPTEKVIRRFVA